MIFAVATGAVVGLLAAAGWVVWLLARPARRRSTGDLALHRLGDGVYMYRGHFSNSAFFVMDGGVVVVDTQVSPTAARRLREMIASVTDLPVRYVVNTHYHGDHTGGNALFPEAEIVATAQTAQFVIERDDERVEYARRFGLEFQQWHETVGPTRTFAGRIELAVGADRFEVVQLGAAETPDACVVHWPARGAVACGDGVATWDYPYTGVPFLDEGLRDDGEWIRFLGGVRAMKPSILIAGHGPALVGDSEIRDRLDLLIALWTDLCDAVRRELAARTPIPALVDKVDAELAHYRRRRDLAEQVTGQRFAIYRVVNNLLPERAGKGWWDDLRPSVVVRAPRAQAEAELLGLAADGVSRRARELLQLGNRPLALSLLERWTELHPDDAAALGLYADVCFDGGLGIVPRVDGTEYLGLASRAARRALALDPDQPLALLALGMSEVLGAMVLAQPMAAGIDKLERAVASGQLTAFQRRKAAFFLGKAHQYEFLPDRADDWFRQALPAWVRPAFPLVRERMRCTP